MKNESRGRGRERVSIGVDVTWFGGQKSDPPSMYESLVGTEVDGQGLWIEAVSLGAAPNAAADDDPCAANADADGALLVEALSKHLGRLAGEGARRFAIGLDAPIFTIQRGLPPRARLGVAGATRNRSSDSALRDRVGVHGSPWSRAVNVQPGAPLPARIERIVSALIRHHGFVVWDGVTPPDASPDRVLLEVFPAGSVWSAGVRGDFGAEPPEWAQLYKRIGKRGLEVASTDAREWARRCFAGVGAALVGCPVKGWAEQMSGWAVSAAATKRGVVKTGKRYDDVIESGIAFLTTRAWADGRAEVFRGADGDGHIVVPGPIPAVVGAATPARHGASRAAPR